MFRGYRRIFFAVAGLALLAGAQDPDKQRQKQNDSGHGNGAATNAAPPNPGAGAFLQGLSRQVLRSLL